METMGIEKEEKKLLNKLKKSLPGMGLTMVLLILCFIFSFFTCGTQPQAIVKKLDGRGFYAKRILVMGNNLITLAGEEMGLKELAKSDFKDSNFSAKIYSLGEISSIEFDQDASLPELKINRKYLGTYTIRLQGHLGTMRLYIKKKRLRGYVKFHTWGKRAYEPLKKVSIKGNRIFFIRSANSSKAIKRIGANVFFTQNFTGNFNSRGTTLKGYMKNNRGERHIWEAKKKKR